MRIDRPTVEALTQNLLVQLGEPRLRAQPPPPATQALSAVR